MPMPSHGGPHDRPAASAATSTQEKCPGGASASDATVETTYESACPPLVTNTFLPDTRYDVGDSASRRVSG